MSNVINIYCDESCHLEHDGKPIMVVGSMWCPKEEVKIISDQIREIKDRHNARGEIKWVKVSESRKKFFLELVEYFFYKRSLKFRCLIVDDKSKLNHKFFNQGSHDSFYYKMYYNMLKHIIHLDNCYNIYLDIKDTRSAKKVAKLEDVLRNKFHDFDQRIICNTQNIHSHESEILQLADLFIGAVGYFNRELDTSSAKLNVVGKISEKARQHLNESTRPWLDKFNLFMFTPQEVHNE